MVHGLLILNSSIGTRDLWWPQDPQVRQSVIGFNIYRAFDAPVDWVKLNDTPIPGNRYRDATTLRTVHYNIQPEDWVDSGEMGMMVVKIPETPYAEVVKGRPTVASHPDSIQIQATYASGATKLIRPSFVSGIDQTVFLSTGRSLTTGELPAGSTEYLGAGAGAVSTFPVIDFPKITQYTIIYRTLTNFVDIFTNMVRTFYTVVPVGDRGEEHAPGAFGTEVVDSNTNDRLDYIYAEMVRRNAWLFEQTGDPAHLLIRRTQGPACGCSSDFTAGRTGCPVCFETGIIGGYYGPIDMLFIDPDVAAIRTIDEGGKKVERKSKSYLGRTPIVEDGDLIVLATGERLSISGVTYKRPRGVLLQQDFDVSLLNPKDTRYLIPIYTPENPIVYNPAIQPDPGNGSQQVYSDATNPAKHNENPDKRTGRTLTFGRIGARGSVRRG